MNESAVAAPKSTLEWVDVDKVGIIRTRRGDLQRFKVPVFLSVEDRGLVDVYGIPVKLVSAEGYKRMAAGASLFTCNAPNVVVGDKLTANPTTMRDAQGAVQQVYCRSLTFGRTTLGAPVVSDRSVIYELNLYKLIDLVAKVTKYPKVFRLVPASYKLGKDEKMWTEYPYDGVTKIIADTAAPEFIDFYRSMINRQKKAVEFAQTFAQRNSIKAHAAINVHTSKDAHLQVFVYSWVSPKGTTNWDHSVWQSHIQQIADMTGGDGGSVEGPEGEQIQVVKGTDRVHDDEAAGAEMAADVDERDPVIDLGEGSGEQQKQEEKVDPEAERLAKLEADIAALEKAVGSEVALKARDSAKIPHDRELNSVKETKLIVYFKLLSAAMDSKPKGGAK